MSHYRMGDKERARIWYNKAVAWMEKNQQGMEELTRFCEAEAVLRMESRVAPNEIPTG